jgi:hypothetical protein
MGAVKPGGFFEYPCQSSGGLEEFLKTIDTYGNLYTEF